jgi:hypothetical protein
VSDLARVEEDAVTVPVTGQHMAGTLLRPDIPVPGFLFIHGWGGGQAEDLGHAEELARLGCVCFTFDLRGHAESDAERDEVTRADGLADVIAAYDYLASQPLVDRSAIGVVGTSYGGYLAILLTAERPVRWLGLRVPALYPDAHWSTPKAKLNKAIVRAYREQPHDAEDDRALKAASDYDGDVLLVESGRDEQIPREAILSLQAAFRQAGSFTHRVIKDATHAMREPAHRRIYAMLLIRWIEEMVRAARFAGASDTADTPLG